MKKDLFIIGTGETGRLAFEYFTHDSNYNVVGFLANKDYIKEPTFCGLNVYELEKIDNIVKDEFVFVAMSSGHLNRDRQKMYEFVKNKGYKFASYVSSKAFVWHDVEIGENCFILENNVLQSGVKIGNNVVLWSGNHVGHLTKIEDNCFVSSHVVISGFVNIGKNTFIGVNSSIADNVSIANDNFIGLGTVINKNTEENAVYVGNPAIKSPVAAKRLCKVKD
jgi:sugar O-acyltransferase (sialic acid O-acetyltransferase NeuD family)